MVVDDPELSSFDLNNRKATADLMAQNIQTLLGTHPDIWDNLPEQIKKRIIEASPKVYTREYGWSSVLDDRISLEKLASFAELAKIRSHNGNGESRRRRFAAEDETPIRSHNGNGESRRRRFAAEDETPVDPDVILGILERKIENLAQEERKIESSLPRRGCSMHRCDSF